MHEERRKEQQEKLLKFQIYQSDFLFNIDNWRFE